MDEQKLLKRKRKAETEGNQALLLSVCTDLAELYKEQGRYRLVIEEYTTIANIYKSDKKLINYAQANRGIGEAYMGLHQFEKALKHQRLYLETAKGEKNSLEEQRALATIGHTYLTWYLDTVNEPNKNYLDLAYKFFMKSLVVCESLTGISKLESVDMSARLFANLGVVQECLGNYDKALELLKKSLNICKQNDIYEQLYRGYISMACLFEKREEFNETIRNYNLAIETAKKLRDKTDLICAALLAKSEVLNKLGDFLGSKQVLLKAYKLGTPNIAERNTIERNLRLVAAMCATEDKLVVTGDDQLELKRLYEIMGDGACDLKNFEKAIEYYKKMLSAAENSGINGKDLGSCYYSLAETYKDNRQFSQAVEYFEKEYALCKNSLKDNLNTLSKIADTKEAGGASVAEVKTVYNRALENCRNNKNLKEEKRMVNRFISYLRRANEHTEAFKMEQYLSSLTHSGADEDSSSSEAESEDSEMKANIGDHICLDDLTDLSEDSDVDVPMQKKDVGSRKRSKQFGVKKNMKGETQLHTACISGSMPVVRHLVEQGHPINVRDNCGWLPLHEASLCGHVDIVRLLLDKGAAVNDRGGTLCNGMTPLHDAASNGHLDVMELLLNRGASAVVKTDEGETPFHTLKHWYNRTNPEGDQLDLYNKLMKRLSDALEKAGQQIKSISLKKTSPVYETEKENIHSSSRQNIGHLRRNLDLIDDFNKSELVDGRNDDNACEYREVMNTLRNKRNNSVSGGSRRSSSISKRPALVSAEDDMDDWLDDDLKGSKMSKKRRMDPFTKISPKALQSASTSSRTGAPSPQNARTSLTSRSNSEEIVVPNSFFDEDFDNDVVNLVDDQWEIQRLSGGSTSSSVSTKRKSQASLLDAGFSRSRSSTSPIATTERMRTSQIKAQQTKITKFGRTKSAMEIPDNSSGVVSGVRTSPGLPEVVQQTISTDPTLFVDVRIEGRLYRVPVLLSQLQTHTIKWLAEEAATRYARKEYMKPTLELETKNGAVLADDDLLSLLFPLGSMQAEQVEARVLKWNLPPLVSRYKEACGQLNTDADDLLCKIVEEMSISLNLASRGIRGNVLAPLCKALSHQSSLLELDLSANFLTTECVQMLGFCLPSLENLYKLNLRCTGLQPNHISLLATACSSSGPSKLADLDLSDNTLKDESFRHLVQLLRHFKLTKCGLSSVGFTSNISQNLSVGDADLQLNFGEIQELDVSENLMDASSMGKIFSATAPYKLKSINVSRNHSFGILSRLVVVLQTGAVNLRILDASRCNVQDSEVYDLLRVSAETLQSINLSYNRDLTGVTLRRLLESSKLRHINLIGCDNILKFFDDITSGSITIGAGQTSDWCLKLSIDWKKFAGHGEAIVKLIESKFLNCVTTERLSNYLSITVKV